MVFEAASYQPDTVCQQGGGKSVALIALKRRAVKAKSERLVPIDVAA
jgi:hypothetical protein